MLLLTTTTDALRVTTAAATAVTVDVAASWADLLDDAVTPGRSNTLITSATTTTVVSSPASSTYRTIKRLSIRNRHATQPSKVTVIHRASGSTDVELIAVTLQSGNSLQYDEQLGFVVQRGSTDRLLVSSNVATTIGDTFVHVLPNDVAVLSSGANARHQDVKELGFQVIEGQRYWFQFTLAYTAAATTTGSRFNVFGPGSITALRMRSTVPTGVATQNTFEGVLGFDASSATTTSAATGSNMAIVEGQIDNPTCDGLFFLRAASEIAGSAITIKAGSFVRWQRTT